MDVFAVFLLARLKAFSCAIPIVMLYMYALYTLYICVEHVVLVVDNSIRAHYNVIMKTTVASGGKLPVPQLVTKCLCQSDSLL